MEEQLALAVSPAKKSTGLTKSDRVYLILEGQGEFIVGNEVIPVAKDDVLIIPRNTEYDYWGQLRLFLVHIPAYEKDSDINLEAPLAQ